MNARIVPLWTRIIERLSALAPLVLLLMRLFVALAFWRAGVVKIESPDSTLYLFSEEYHVPLLPAAFAAAMATWIELVLPWFLALGLGTRAMAAFLFVYNLVAVISYPALWPHGFWHGLAGSDFADHKAWGLMLLALVALGAGRWSLDALLARVLERRAAARN